MPTLYNDIGNTIVGGTSIRAQAALTADTNGGAIDFLTADGNVFAIVSAGVIDTASSDETYVIEFEESSDNSTWTDIDSNSITVTITASNTDKYADLRMKRTKRYVRSVLNVSGTTPSFLGTVYLAGHKKITGAVGGSQL